MFDLTDLAVTYGATQALAPTTLAIEAGETLVLLGPSGSGKSTLLRSLAGLTPATGSLRSATARLGVDERGLHSELWSGGVYSFFNVKKRMFETRVLCGRIRR